jgi:hypothetical protein
MAESDLPRRLRSRKIKWGARKDTDIYAKTPASPFGQWLLAQMERLDWTVGDLSGRGGFSPSTIYKFLEYVAPAPDFPTCLRLAKLLEVPVIELYAVLGYLDEPSSALLKGALHARPIFLVE